MSCVSNTSYSLCGECGETGMGSSLASCADREEEGRRAGEEERGRQGDSKTACPMPESSESRLTSEEEKR